ncbi:hypothetical protein M747DRAFT_85046 [Aspergillus niger ATCC 13496]|uniref:Uncharacterized protein n=1 Tax=Aspergillus niger ATCC 13496 TaxID=1353008 RepID=A0A370BQW9_ASPNG|nr:hypothetical protein M747DRAFT_85046 [Aspergillus niger ATCC 13496]
MIGTYRNTAPRFPSLLFSCLSGWLSSCPSLPSLLYSLVCSTRRQCTDFLTLATGRPATPSSDRVEECDRSADPNMNCRYPHLHTLLLACRRCIHRMESSRVLTSTRLTLAE